MAKKTDWIKQIKFFLKNHEDTVEERKIFCKNKGLVYNSFRVKLSQYKKSDQFKNSLAQQTPLSEAKKRSTQQAREEAKNLDEKGTTRARLTDSITQNQPTNIQRKDGTRSFAPGNKAHLIHGKYAKKAFLDDEYQELSALPLEVQVRLLKQHIHLINNVSVERIQFIRKEYEEGRPLTRVKLDEKGNITETAIPMDEALVDASTQAAGPMTEMIKALGTVEKGLVESECKVRLQPTYSRVEMDSHFAEVMNLRVESKWTALQTLGECVQRMLEPPAWLLKEVEFELRNAEPEIDDSEGVSPDEAAAIIERQRERTANANAWLEKRRRKNAEIYAASKGVGDEKLTVSTTIDGECTELSADDTAAIIEGNR